MYEMDLDYFELLEKSKNAKKLAVVAIVLKCAVVLFGLICKPVLAILLCGLSFWVLFPTIGVLCLALIIIILPFLAISWIAYFAYIAFAAAAIVQSVRLIAEGRETPEGSLPREVNDKVTFAMASSIIIFFLMFLQ